MTTATCGAWCIRWPKCRRWWRAKRALVTTTILEKGHARIEARAFTAANPVDWIASDRPHPGRPRVAGIDSVVEVCCRTGHADRSTFETHRRIRSARPDIGRPAWSAGGHWGVERMHWLPDVEWQDDPSRHRTGYGAKDMAVVRRFALDLVRIDPRTGSVKIRRTSAGWNEASMRETLGLR